MKSSREEVDDMIHALEAAAVSGNMPLGASFTCQEIAGELRFWVAQADYWMAQYSIVIGEF